MKLRNKKTGVIRDFIINKDKIQTSSVIDYWVYNSLAELNEEWGDVPDEPKPHYSINQFGDVIDDVDEYMSKTIDEMKQISNYFDTREETEKAVEKLKAWKRLKDKGFRFKWWVRTTDNLGDTIEITATSAMMTCSKDLDLLFGGEDN